MRVTFLDQGNDWSL